MATKWVLIACVVAVIWADVAPSASSSHHGHAHAPAPAIDCLNLVSTLVDCLSFVSNDSTQTKPQGKCCSSLKTVLSTAPNCLCDTFKSSGQLGVPINTTKALTLPAACKLHSPSLSNCELSLSPDPAPAPASGGASAAANGSPGGAPSSTPGNAASAFVPISAGSFIICLMVVASLIPF